MFVAFLTKDIVAVVGIELWMSPSVSCLVFGESRRYLH